MQPAIRVENLGKRYRINHAVERGGYRTLRESLARSAGGLARRFRDNGDSGQAEDFWALKDVSFEVQPGEVVGIIGRNGAGKSTLLKILSRITKPTSGHVSLRGRVGSLLEVGTGFHPELTGRENIYLNGAILGMSRSDITRQFDAIVDFAGTEQFLDTPVKRYSSGMYVRLAFAVAAHLSHELLIVDEVLAVGDTGFQRKCLAKMGDIARHGRTVLFVSHDLTAIQKLSSKAVVLRSGAISHSGPVDECIDLYCLGHASMEDTGIAECSTNQRDLRFVSATMLDENGSPLSALRIMQPFNVQIRFSANRAVTDLVIGIGIFTQRDMALYATHTNDYGRVYQVDSGLWETTARVEPNYLREGSYYFGLGAVSKGELLAQVPRACDFTVEPVLNDPTAHYDKRIGVLFIPMKWDRIHRSQS